MIDYTQLSKYTRIEYEVATALQYELAKLDSGHITDNGLQFHTRCLEKLHETFQNIQSIPESFLVGYMYERTNRCVHRFDRARP